MALKNDIFNTKSLKSKVFDVLNLVLLIYSLMLKFYLKISQIKENHFILNISVFIRSFDGSVCLKM